ncbi:unnamed protein product [Urochloa humidicola]
MQLYARSPAEPCLGVDEWRAGEVLGERERDETQHGEAAVPELGVGAHDAAAPRLGALPPEHRHQRRHGEHGRRGREPGEPGPAPGLRQEAPAAGRLDGQRRYEPTMARRALMRSGAGSLNASASHRPGLDGFFAAAAAGLGFGVGVAGDGEDVDAAAVGCYVVGSASSAWALTTRARRRGTNAAEAGTRTER